MMERINDHALLYRVGSATMAGLWYDQGGNYTGLIHTLPDAIAAPLPMGRHPIFRAHGKEWVSCTDTKEMLRRWFSPADAQELIARGYDVQEIEVRRYARVYFDTFNHEVFCAEDVIRTVALDPTDIYPELYQAARAA